MSNCEFIDDLLDATMKRLYDAFGKPDMRKPGADETPPRNVRCGRCKQWLTDAEWKYAPPRTIHDNCPGGKP